MSNELDMKPVPSTLEQDTILRDRSEEPERRLTPMMPFDLGEQIVGSNHRFPVGQPVNLSKHAGALHVSVSGDPAMSAVRFEPQLLIPREPSAPIELAYAPTTSGESRAKLVMTAKWDDGHEEKQAVPITGRARTLVEAPGAGSGVGAARQAAPSAEQARPVTPSAEPESAALNDGSELALAALGRVFELQGLGVTAVEQDQAKFVAAKDEPSIWWDLAELALAMGTAGVGKIVESAVTAKVEHFLESRGAAAKEFHRAVGVAKAVHHAESEAKSIVPEVVGTAAADGLKDALEHGKEFGSKLKANEKSESGEQEPTESRGDSVDFFTHQHEGLVNANRAAMDGIVALRASLRPIAKTNPAAAVAAMQAVTASYDELGQNAVAVQGQATAAQFAAFKARGSLGDESVRTPAGARTATDLDNTRDPFHDSDGFHPALKADGLVDIDVEIRGDSVRVTGARVTGLAQKVADRLVKADLLTAGVPVRIKTQALYGDITRDEVGRVRCSQLGRSLDGESEAPEPETQRVRGAERVVRLVLGKRLVDWGIEHMKTNAAPTPEAQDEGRRK